jgi:hypothetical protein
MLYREIIAVCCQIRTKHINTLCGRNVELCNVKLAVHIVRSMLYSCYFNLPHSQSVLHDHGMATQLLDVGLSIYGRHPQIYKLRNALWSSTLDIKQRSVNSSPFALGLQFRQTPRHCLSIYLPAGPGGGLLYTR